MEGLTQKKTQSWDDFHSWVGEQVGKRPWDLELSIAVSLEKEGTRCAQWADLGFG